MNDLEIMTDEDIQITPNAEKEITKLNPVLLFVITLLVPIIFILFIIAPSGKWDWVEGWIYVLTLFFLFFIMIFLLNNKNPEILINRMKVKKETFSKKNTERVSEKAKKAAGTDKIIMPALMIFSLALFIIPGLDHRNNWSSFPIWLEILGILMLIISFYILYRVMLENAYGSKVLDIREGQKLIDTGPYKIVRHPMYVGFSLMFLSVPLGLGSWWGLILSIFIVLILGLRIKYEEEMLTESLPGYVEYKQKVKYRLIPKIY